MVGERIKKRMPFRKIDTFEYFIAIFLVYCNGSWLNSEAKSLLLFGMFFLLIVYLVLRKTIYNELVAPSPHLIILALFPLISVVFNLDNNPNLISVIFVSATYLILGCFKFDRYISLLNRVAHFLYILACISSVIGVITLIDYSILAKFPVRYNAVFGSEATMGYYNLILYTDRVANDFRTQGIFWEPGAWAFNQIFALYWFTFMKVDLKKASLLIFSLLLTLSTTGLFLAAIIVVMLFIKTKSKLVKSRIIIGFSFGLLIIILAISYLGTKGNIDVGQLIYEQTIEKFTSDSKSTSLEERIGSSRKAYEIAEANPFFGIGKTSTETQLYVTSGLAELAYQLGFIYLIYYLVIYRVLFRKLGWLISIPFILVMINGEAYSYYILSSLILVYGTKTIGISEQKIDLQLAKL